MSISSLENSPIQGIRGTGSVSDCDQETHSPVSVCSSDHAPQSDRPERMREWIIRYYRLSLQNTSYACSSEFLRIIFEIVFSIAQNDQLWSLPWP